MKSAWRKLKRDISNCERCKALVQTRNKPIPGVGNPEAKVFIVGLAPGKDGADLTGIPFTRDPSGELFDEMLSVAGLSRTQDVFITNLVKCNPKDSHGRNRTPSKREINTCFPYMKREIDLIKPRIVVTLGKAATEFLLNTKVDKMAEFHGKCKSKSGDITLFPFIHPGYVIRGAHDKGKYLEKFKILGEIYRDLIKKESKLSRLDILLLLLKKGSHDGSKGVISGKTRLQKLLFLVQDELTSRGYKARYAFRPYLYGPYSRELYTDIEWLRMNDLIEVKTNFDEYSGLTTDFMITEKGKKKLEKVMDPFVFENIDEIVEGVIAKYGQMSVTQLVEFVHKEFSNYDRKQLGKNKARIKMKLDYFFDSESKGLSDKASSPKKEI